MKKIIEFITTIIFGFMVLWCLFNLTGCSMIPIQQADSVIDNPIPPATKVIWKTIKSTDWLASLFILCIAGGVFAGLNGLKAGWVAVISALVGLVVKAGMSNVYMYWGCGLILLAVIVLVIVSIVIKNKAIKELICGTQKLRDEFILQDRDTAVKVLAENQSKETTKLVLNTKANLKLKGKI